MTARDEFSNIKEIISEMPPDDPPPSSTLFSSQLSPFQVGNSVNPKLIKKGFPLILNFLR